MPDDIVIEQIIYGNSNRNRDGNSGYGIIGQSGNFGSLDSNFYKQRAIQQAINTSMANIDSVGSARLDNGDMLLWKTSGNSKDRLGREAYTTHMLIIKSDDVARLPYPPEYYLLKAGST